MLESNALGTLVENYISNSGTIISGFTVTSGLMLHVRCWNYKWNLRDERLLRDDEYQTYSQYSDGMTDKSAVSHIRHEVLDL